MSFIKCVSTVLAAGSLMPAVLAAPVASNNNNNFNKRGVDTYSLYTGTGSANWPSMDKWVSSFDDLFAGSVNVMKDSCTQWHVPNNSDQEIADIKSGISTVAQETGVDARFIFAVMMQESNGCVRAPTTNYGVRNPGLMQDHDGTATCNEGGVQKPCPASTITQMIRDGVAGTKAGDGLVQTLAQAGGSDVSRYYKAARIYNSGSVDKSGDLGAGIATHCYSTDIANRLTGWATTKSACTLDGGSGAAAAPAPAASSAAPVAPVASAEPVAAPAPAPPAVAPVAPVPSAPAAAPAAPITPAPASPSKSLGLAPGVLAGCAKYHTVVAGDVCDAVAKSNGATFAQLRQWNTQIDAGCTNLWLGYDYCVVPAGASASVGISAPMGARGGAYSMQFNDVGGQGLTFPGL